ncbi:MAG TPA: Sec-independent protein translocase protein TatB [Acetobacteraceae bacterium]
MFDFAWSEIALIGIVALVAIGPKDLPVAIKAVAALIKKARRMAGEFQVHVDEMMREADLQDVRREFNDLRRMDIKGRILSAVDSDGTIRKTMTDNPLAASTTLTTPPPPADTAPLPAADTVALPAAEHAATEQHEMAFLAATPPTLPPADVSNASVADAAHPAPAPEAAPPAIPPTDAKQPSLHG